MSAVVVAVADVAVVLVVPFSASFIADADEPVVLVVTNGGGGGDGMKGLFDVRLDEKYPLTGVALLDGGADRMKNGCSLSRLARK